MKNLTKSLTILACCGGFFAACGGDDTAPAAAPVGGAGGTGGTVAAAGGGAGGTATGGAGGATGGTGGVAGGAGGATGGGGSGGTGGAPPPPPPFCEDQTPKTLPFKLITNAAYVPSGWFPTADDMTPVVPDCTNAPITLPAVDAGAGDGGAVVLDAGGGDAGSGDAGSGDSLDAGAPPPQFTTCLGITYEHVSASPFAGINWVPNNGGANSCFEGVGAVEFWAAGSPGYKVNFEAHGTVLEVTLTEEWKKYSIAIAADLNTTGVPIAFTMGFDSTAQPNDLPFTVFYADPTYVE